MNAAIVVTFASALAADFGLVELNYAGQPKESPVIMAIGLVMMISGTWVFIFGVYLASVLRYW